MFNGGFTSIDGIGEFRNQCDGCQRGLPVKYRIEGGGPIHELSGELGAYPGEVISCTAERYHQPKRVDHHVES